MVDKLGSKHSRWQSEYHDAMIDHDKNVGQVLGVLDELGIANNTIVFYSTDNGPHMNSWPEGRMTSLRSEKNSNWEGAYRVPAMVRWPGRIKPGSVSNEIISHLDWLPTFVAAAGDPDIKGKLLEGHAVFLLVPAQQFVGRFLSTFKEYPPRQKAASFTVDQVMEQLRSTTGSR
jgi:arylsulfatase